MTTLLTLAEELLRLYDSEQCRCGHERIKHRRTKHAMMSTVHEPCEICRCTDYQRESTADQKIAAWIALRSEVERLRKMKNEVDTWLASEPSANKKGQE